MKVVACLVYFEITLGNVLAGTPSRPSSGVPVCKKKITTRVYYKIFIKKFVIERLLFQVQIGIQYKRVRLSNSAVVQKTC